MTRTESMAELRAKIAAGTRTQKETPVRRCHHCGEAVQKTDEDRYIWSVCHDCYPAWKRQRDARIERIDREIVTRNRKLRADLTCLNNG